MQRYFFHIRDGRGLTLDFEGECLPGLEAVRSQACEASRDIIADRVRFGQALDHKQFEVVDSGGKTVLVYPFMEAIKLN